MTLATHKTTAKLKSISPVEKSIFHLASEYQDRGYSIIPLTGKVPALSSWKEYQIRRPAMEEVRSWFQDASPNIGIVTGIVSGLVVVDTDTPEEAVFWRAKFPNTPLSVSTGRGGMHFYYRMPQGESVTNRAKVMGRAIDLRGEGGYVVAPPSVHPETQKIYEWSSFGDYSLEDVPFFDSAWVQSTPSVLSTPQTSTPLPTASRNGGKIRYPLSYIAKIAAVSGEGGHGATYRVACILRDAGFAADEATAVMLEWNKTNASPPWSEKELLHKVEDAYKKQSGPKGQKPR